MKQRSSHPVWHWLLLGILLTPVTGMRFNIAFVAWFSTVPWMLALRQLDGWRGWLGLFAALQLAMFANVATIVTDPIPLVFAPMFSVPMAIGAFLSYGLFELLRRRLGDAWGIVLFVALAVGMDWLSANGSEMGSWGSMAYTQLDDLPLLQLASVFGLAGITALVALSNAVIAVAIAREDRKRLVPVGLGVVALVLLAHAWGAYRLTLPLEGPTLRVATVVTHAQLVDGALPEGSVLAQATDQLFEDTESAASAGAQVVVWNEGATAVAATEEQALLDRGQMLAAAHGIDLVMAYVVPLDGMAHFENKYVWMTPEGPIETYFKHHPVPGEGAVRGTDPIQVHERPWGRGAGAICYDYDFPGLGSAHATGGADVVFVPSSDWRGIDPVHTRMASVRGIEGGFSVVRSVRAAASGAFDAHGVARGLARDSEGQHVLVADVPVSRIPTLYSRWGDVLPLGALGILLIGTGTALTGWLRLRRRPTRAGAGSATNAPGRLAPHPPRARSASR